MLTSGLAWDWLWPRKCEQKGYLSLWSENFQRWSLVTMSPVTSAVRRVWWQGQLHHQPGSWQRAVADLRWLHYVVNAINVCGEGTETREVLRYSSITEHILTGAERPRLPQHHVLPVFHPPILGSSSLFLCPMVLCLACCASHSP